MSRWTIYDKNGDFKYEASNLEYHDVWMGEEYVTVNISSPTPINIEIGDYVVYRGLTYTIYSLPTALKQARKDSYGDAFKYDTVKFSARSTELTEIRFFDIVLHDNNLHYTSLPTFSFYAETVDDLLDRIQANIDRDNEKPWIIVSYNYTRTVNRYAEGSVARAAADALWRQTFGEPNDNPSSAERANEKTKVNISIDKQDIFNSLQHIKNSFGLNFITRERTIIVGHEGIVAAETYFQYGKDKGFYEIERTAEADQQIVTKLFAYGSDKNIPTRYYAEFGKKYFVNADSAISPVVNPLVVAISFRCDVHGEEYYPVKSSTEITEPETAVDIRRIVTLECDGYTCKGYYREYHNGQGTTGRNYEIHVASIKIGTQEDIDEPSYSKAKAFAEAVRGKTRVNIIEGIDKKIWPSNHVSYDTSMPNQMAVNVLMLPGFPEESLKTLCDVSYDASTNKTTISIRKNTESPYKPLMVLDGNQQIDFSEDRLMPYITSPNMDALGVKEGDIHFTEEDDDNGLKEICPTVKGMTEDDVFFNGNDAPLDEIVACEIIKDDGAYKTDDPEYEFPDFHITIPNLGFNLYEAAKESGELTISLTDGYCGGRDFKVEVKEENIKQNDDGTWRLTVQRSPDDTLSLMFPYSDAASHGETPIANEPYQIRTGDHYVLSGINIKETSYIWSASMEVLRKSITWLLNNDYTRFTYLPKIDEIYMARQNDEAIASHGAINSMHDTLKSGMLMWFEDEDLDFDGTIFIDTLTIKEDGNNGIPTYEVVLRNDKQVGTLQRVQNQVNSLTTFVNNGGGGMSSNQIRTLIRDYGIDYYLSKLVDDVAEGIIGFRKGLWVKAKGLFGVDEDGKAKVSDLYANGDANIVGKLDVGGQATIDNIKSKNYSGDGIGDTGWSITNSNNGHSKLTIDELYVRMKAVFESLEVRERTYTGGDQIWSCAGNQIVRTDYLGNNETADHVPVMAQCRADGSPVSGGTAGEPVVSVPEVGETYGYSTVKVPWLLRGAAMILGRNNGLVQGLFSRYSKVRFVIGDEEVSSSRGNRSATVSDISKIRRARCYFLAKDGEREVKNWWRINDLARCQTMNLSNVTRQTYISGEDTKAGNIFWWRKVIGVSYEPVQLDDGKWYHYFDVAFDYDLEESSPETMATSVLEGSDIPAAGDAVVQFGNTIIEGRMNLMMMEVNGGDAVGYSASTDAPCLKAYRGVYCFDLSKSWVGGHCCKMKLSPKSGYEFYGPQFKQVTEYDVVPVPVDRGLYINIQETRDDYEYQGTHRNVRKCYYYDKVSHDGSYWLCSIVDGSHWVDGSENYISDSDYAALSDNEKAQCARKQNYTTETPSDGINDWTKLVAKGTSAWIGTIDRNTYSIQCDASGTVTSQQSVTVNLNLLHGSEEQSFKIAGIRRNSTTVSGSNAISNMMFVINNQIFDSLPSAAATAHSLSIVYFPTSTINNSDDIEIAITDANGGNRKVLHLIVNGIRPGANGTNGKDGWMITADPANVIITQALGNDTTQFTTQSVTFTAKKGNVDASIVSVLINSQTDVNTKWEHFTGSVSGTTVTVTSPTTYTPQGGTAQYYTEGYFIAAVGVTDPDSNSTITFYVKVPCYANLLGTWKQTVEASEEVIAAQKISYALNNGDDTKTVDQSKATFNSVRNAAESYQEWARVDNTSVGSKTYINTHLANAEENISVATKKVNDGKNLLTLTSGWEGYGGAAVNYDKKYFGVKSSGYLYSPVRLGVEGEQYCFSAYIAVGSQIAGNPGFCYGTSYTYASDLDDNGTYQSATFIEIPGDTITIGSTTYQRYYFHIPGSIVKERYFTIYNDGGYWLYCPQLEVGSTPTSFSAGSIETSSQIKQTADEIDLSITNKLGDTGIKINGNNRQIDLIADKVKFKNSAGTVDNKIWIDSTTGALHAVDGKFSGNIYTPYLRITSSNYSDYVKEYQYSGGTWHILEIDTNNVQLENIGQASNINLPFLYTDDYLGCELNVLNLTGNSIDINGSAGYVESSLVFVQLLNYTGNTFSNNLQLGNGKEAKFKLIKYNQGQGERYFWIVTSLTS